MGWFDVHFEASANSHAMRNGLEVLKPRGLMMQIGLGGDVALPQNLIVSKEIDVRGTFRFHEEFALAVEAFEFASDKSRAMKVEIRF